jgi:hypothetical protein
VAEEGFYREEEEDYLGYLGNQGKPSFDHTITQLYTAYVLSFIKKLHIKIILKIYINE